MQWITVEANKQVRVIAVTSKKVIYKLLTVNKCIFI